MTDLELILVDNGAGLDPAKLGAPGRDSRLRIVSLPENRGASAGRNAAFALSRGEFIALLDYDDIALPRRLEKQVALLRAEPRLGLVSCLAESIDGQGRVLGQEFSLLSQSDQEIFSNYSMPSSPSGFTGRREFFARFPFRPAFDLTEDYDFLARAVEVCPIQGLPENLIRYRHHEGQCSRERMVSQVLSACLVRLVTARRRQGRPEDLQDLLNTVAPWRQQPPAVEVVYAHFAKACLREGFLLQAVYHARRLMAARRNFRTMGQATVIFLRSLLRAKGQAGPVLRMFFRGPLRTHDLVPARPNAGE